MRKLLIRIRIVNIYGQEKKMIVSEYGRDMRWTERRRKQCNVNCDGSFVRRKRRLERKNESPCISIVCEDDEAEASDYNDRVKSLDWKEMKGSMLGKFEKL